MCALEYRRELVKKDTCFWVKVNVFREFVKMLGEPGNETSA